jgi:hypothetical protein
VHPLKVTMMPEEEDEAPPAPPAPARQPVDGASQLLWALIIGLVTSGLVRFLLHHHALLAALSGGVAAIWAWSRTRDVDPHP